MPVRISKPCSTVSMALQVESPPFSRLERHSSRMHEVRDVFLGYDPFVARGPSCLTQSKKPSIFSLDAAMGWMSPFW